MFCFSVLGLRKLLLPLQSIFLPAEMNVAQKGDLAIAAKLIEAAAAGFGDSRASDSLELDKSSASVAFLFLAQNSIVHLQLWRQFLEINNGADRNAYNVYLHFSDNSPEGKAKQAKTLAALPHSSVQVVPTVETHWCELMAGMVSLYAAAFSKPRNAKFILLSHDAMPLSSLRQTRHVLLERPEVSSVCFAGIKRMEVPYSCSYGVQLLWKQPLQLKHHQWSVLSRCGTRVTTYNHA